MTTLRHIPTLLVTFFLFNGLYGCSHLSQLVPIDIKPKIILKTTQTSVHADIKTTRKVQTILIYKNGRAIGSLYPDEGKAGIYLTTSAFESNTLSPETEYNFSFRFLDINDESLYPDTIKSIFTDFEYVKEAPSPYCAFLCQPLIQNDSSLFVSISKHGSVFIKNSNTDQSFNAKKLNRQQKTISQIKLFDLNNDQLQDIVIIYANAAPIVLKNTSHKNQVSFKAYGQGNTNHLMSGHFADIFTSKEPDMEGMYLSLIDKNRHTNRIHLLKILANEETFITFKTIIKKQIKLVTNTIGMKTIFYNQFVFFGLLDNTNTEYKNKMNYDLLFYRGWLGYPENMNTDDKPIDGPFKIIADHHLTLAKKEPTVLNSLKQRNCQRIGYYIKPLPKPRLTIFATDLHCIVSVGDMIKNNHPKIITQDSEDQCWLWKHHNEEKTYKASMLSCD